MTPADQLRAQARQLLDLADQLDAAAPHARPAGDTPERSIDTSRASRISGRSFSWLYKNGPRHGFGRRMASGAWTFSEPLLRAFVAGEKSACEKNDGTPRVCEVRDDVGIHTMTTSD